MAPLKLARMLTKPPINSSTKFFSSLFPIRKSLDKLPAQRPATLSQNVPTADDLVAMKSQLQKLRSEMADKSSCLKEIRAQLHNLHREMECKSGGLEAAQVELQNLRLEKIKTDSKFDNDLPFWAGLLWITSIAAGFILNEYADQSYRLNNAVYKQMKEDPMVELHLKNEIRDQLEDPIVKMRLRNEMREELEDPIVKLRIQSVVLELLSELNERPEMGLRNT